MAWVSCLCLMAITHGSTMPAFVNAGGAGSKPAPAAQLNHGGAVNAAPAIDIDTAGGAGSVPALAGPIDRRRPSARPVRRAPDGVLR